MIGVVQHHPNQTVDQPLSPLARSGFTQDKANKVAIERKNNYNKMSQSAPTA
jgi:hypothetical protein